MDSAGNVVATTLSNADGSYNIDTLAPGNYTLVASASTHLPSSQASVSLNQGGTVSGLNLVLSGIAVSDASVLGGIQLADGQVDLSYFQQPIPP